MTSIPSLGGVQGSDPSHLPQSGIHVQKQVQPSGRVVKRLAVDQHDPESSVAFVKLKNPDSFFGKVKYGVKKIARTISRSYVDTNIETIKEGQTKQIKVAINVNSLSKRLGISKGEIKALEREGRLADVLQTTSKGAQAGADIHQFLGAEEGQRVSARQLTQLFTANALQSQATMQIGAKTLHLKGSRITSDRQQLGAGTFGTAYKVQGLAVSSFQVSTFVQKVSNTDPYNPQFGIQAREDIETECQNLREITDLAKLMHREDALEGLQEAPIEVTYEGPKGSERGVMSGKLYQGDLNGKQAEMNVGQKLKGMAPLLKGLAFIQEVGLVHVDIKPQNIFVDKNERGDFIFRLADFGGARWTKDLVKHPQGSITHTRAYTPDPRVENINTHDAVCLHRIGTFQMGVTLFQVLSGGQLPYEITDQGFQYPREGRFNQKALAGYPQDVVDFVKSMVDPDPSRRPTGDQIGQRWQSIVDTHGGIEQLAQTAQESRETAQLVAKAEQDLRYYNIGRCNREMCERDLRDGTHGTYFVMRYTDNYKQGGNVISGMTKDGKFVHCGIDDPAVVAKLKEGQTIVEIINKMLGYE